MEDYEKSFAFRLLQKFESMRERVQNYIAVVDLCPVPAFITARDGATILYVNGAYRRLTGKSEEALQNMDWLLAIHPEDRVETAQAWKNYLLNLCDGKTLAHQHRYLSAESGQAFDAITYTTAVVNNGIVGYVIPANCVGLLALGIDLHCAEQQAKATAALAATMSRPASS